jgi:hypothetical protein
MIHRRREDLFQVLVDRVFLLISQKSHLCRSTPAGIAGFASISQVAPRETRVFLSIDSMMKKLVILVILAEFITSHPTYRENLDERWHSLSEILETSGGCPPHREARERHQQAA